MKTALIRQPAGLGDILWMQPLVDDMSRRGFNVIYPVIDHYYDMVTNNIKTNNSNFIRESDLSGDLLEVYKQTREIIEDDFEYYPFDCIGDPSTESYRPEFSDFTVMQKKPEYYKSINPEYDYAQIDWRDTVKIIRNCEREKAYEDAVGVGENEEFIWANRCYGTPPGVIYRDININNEDIKIIENDNRLTNVFDVCGLLEKATEIHTVDTCFCYLVELLNVGADLNLYSRKRNDETPDNIASNIDEVFRSTGYSCYKKNWKRHL